jgi:hypothetical protein
MYCRLETSVSVGIAQLTGHDVRIRRILGVLTLSLSSDAKNVGAWSTYASKTIRLDQIFRGYLFVSKRFHCRPSHYWFVGFHWFRFFGKLKSKSPYSFSKCLKMIEMIISYNKFLLWHSLTAKEERKKLGFVEFGTDSSVLGNRSRVIVAYGYLTSNITAYWEVHIPTNDRS